MPARPAQTWHGHMVIAPGPQIITIMGSSSTPYTLYLTCSNHTLPARRDKSVEAELLTNSLLGNESTSLESGQSSKSSSLSPMTI